MKFHHNQKMKVIKNFYKGYTGKIKDFDLDNEKLFYLVEVVIDDKTEMIRCTEDELKPSWF